MALVSYGASDDSDYSEDEDGNEAIIVNNKGEQVNGTSSDKVIEDHISDEEDFIPPTTDSGSGSLWDDTPDPPDLMSLIAKKLPKVKHVEKTTTSNTLIDENEDISAIPVKKDYGDKLEEPPSKKMKKDKAAGPVKITIPSLTDLEEDEDDRPVVKTQPSKTGSGLFALLPQPKNKMARPVRTPGINPVLSNSEVPKPGGPLSSNNLKPVAVRKVGLVPHRVANPIKPTTGPTKPPATNSDSDSDDDYLGVGGINSSSYFPAPAPPSNNKYKKVNSAPQAAADSYSGIPNPSPMPSHSSLPPTLPSDNSFVSLNMTDDITPTGTPYKDLGPAVAPYPPPMPRNQPDSQSGLVDNQDAILRLAGKQNKMKDFKDDQMNIIDVSEDDMKGDPLVWMTKAMTEEKAPRPTGKGPKGLAKTRHQITYLAHQAKEREWELKQDWATARENRRASANKYGFM